MSFHGAPKIYVADLAEYVAGQLRGVWIDAAQDPEDIHAEVQAMLAQSSEPGAEEWAIHDYEGFRPIRLSEYESFETVSAVAKLIEEHGELAALAIDHFGGPSQIDEAESALTEQYQGAFDSLDDWAQNFADDTGASAETYRSYIDWQAVGRDAEYSGDVFTLQTSDGKVHVFFSR